MRPTGRASCPRRLVKGKAPSPVSVHEMSPFPSLLMSDAPTLTTPTWTITIIQYDGGCDLCSSTYSGGGGGSSGGSGSSGGGGIIGGGTCSGDDCIATPGDGLVRS